MRHVTSTLILLLIALPSLAATVNVTVGPGTVFNPSSVTVSVGDTVTWNFAESNHTTTSNATIGPETWSSGVRTSGSTFSHTFATAGDYPYYCAVHSFPGGTAMNGVVHVPAAAPAVSTPALSMPLLALLALALSAIGLAGMRRA